MYLLIKPLGSVIFKWGGVNSILLNGSINSGYFEPLPLPSTIYGLLKYAYIINGLGKEPPSFKGPLLYAKGNEKEVLCIHLYSQGLKCNINGNEEDKKVEEEDFERRIGIAIDRNTKSTKEGYIYMERMLDLYKLTNRLLEEAPQRYGILLEVKDEKTKKLDGLIVPFGGESRPAKISVVDEIMKNKKIGKRLLASPAIVDKGDGKSIEWGQESVKIESYTNKITYRLMSLGFEVNRRLPIRLALMPTVEVLDRKDSIGYCTDKGWGSVVEL